MVAGSNLRDIVVNAGGSDERRSLARTIQLPKADADSKTIKVEGRSEVVQKILQRIREIVAERESQVTEIIDVPIEQHRSLIGRGGEVKRQLESQFQVSMDVPRQGDGQTGVKLTGQPENVAKAKDYVAEVVKQQKGETILVPRRDHHTVSNGGQLFRELRNNYQVTVDHGGHEPPVRVDGRARAKDRALPLITDAAEEGTVDAHSWTVVKTASEEEGEIPWVLRGRAEKVAKAKALIAKALEQAQEKTFAGYLVLPDPKTYRLVVGPNGSKVNWIREQSSCRIQVPRDQGKGEAIEILGSREGVEKAKELVLAAVREGQGKMARE